MPVEDRTREAIRETKYVWEDKGTALISNDTQDDIIALVVFGFTLAIIVGVLGYVIGRFNTR